MPSYESATGVLHVMDLIVVKQTQDGALMFTPRSYAGTVARAPTGDLTCLHDDPDAVWSWRPILYNAYTTDGGITRLGSQEELVWRVGLAQVYQRRADEQDEAGRFYIELLAGMADRYGTPDRVTKNGRKRFQRAYAAFIDELNDRPLDPLPYELADERALELLRECLSPQQRLDLARHHGFFVRGRINRLYFVELGNGFDIADPVTRESKVGMCLHPDEWIPHADVALATKLAIDAGAASEAELLEAARPRLLPAGRPANGYDRIVSRLERRYQL
jgi:hypothetical protein